MKKHSHVHRNVLKRQKHQEIKVQCLSNPEREIQEKEGKTEHHSRRVEKKKRLKLKNGPFTILKASRIPFSPNTPHQIVQHNPPNNYITMSPEIARPSIQQICYPLRHHPTNTKQTKDHTPYLRCNRTVKEEMIYRFPHTLCT